MLRPPPAQIFPQRPDQPFPRTFVDTVRTIFKRLFRVYAHIYHSHWDVTVSLGAEAHLNTCFKHFMYFTHTFSLVEKKELAPLAGACACRALSLSACLRLTHWTHRLGGKPASIAAHCCSCCWLL